MNRANNFYRHIGGRGNNVEAVADLVTKIRERSHPEQGITLTAPKDNPLAKHKAERVLIPMEYKYKNLDYGIEELGYIPRYKGKFITMNNLRYLITQASPYGVIAQREGLKCSLTYEQLANYPMNATY